MHMRIVNMWIANSIYSHNHSYYIIIHIRPINTEIQAEKEEQTDRPKQIKILGPTTLDDWGLTKKSHFNYKRWQYQTNLILIFLPNRRLWSNEMFTDLPRYDVHSFCDPTDAFLILRKLTERQRDFNCANETFRNRQMVLQLTIWYSSQN